MAPILFRRWRLATVPRFGQFYVHSITLVTPLAASMWTGKPETILTWIGIVTAASVHAIGHLAASCFEGEQPESVTLYPLWSTTRLFRPPIKIADDLLVTVSGPLANGLLGAAMLFAFDGPLGRNPEWFGQWARIQIAMGIFSLLPVFPLDGSRLIRLCLMWKFPERRAWEIAGFAGQAAAAGFVLWGLIQGVYLVAFLGIGFYLSGRFSPLLLQIHKQLSDVERSEEAWSESHDSHTITLTQTADGVWQHLEPSPSNELRFYF